ncbi:MAG: LacI family transcriptional regulator [Chthoniobacter sp.]|jgi:LacI family transcriptional regulator|nr:LacI family transcriptional regulator [Chthoniobacter sp.]
MKTPPSTEPPRSRSRPPKVALLIETSNAYARGLLAGIEDYIRNYGPWNVYLAEHGRGERVPQWLPDWNGDGILARIENQKIAEALAAIRIPVVDVSSYRLLPKVPAVTTDNEGIARMALEHFTERGFRRFAYCGDARFAWSVARGAQFDAMTDGAGFACAHYPQKVRRESNSDLETDAIARWLGSLTRPIAIFACYDARGQQVLDACRRAGFSAPEQVAVLGVDNDELLCELSPPPLSSVKLNTGRTGWLAAELLARQMAGEKLDPEVLRIPPLGVVTRQSTDTLAVDDAQIASALHFIREHACSGTNVEEVARRAGLSRRLLEMRFRAVLGRPPHDEIMRVQLDRVKELLRQTDLSLAEIAERAGFSHVEYLSAIFKKKVGVPPSQYRRQQVPSGRGRRKP